MHPYVWSLSTLKLCFSKSDRVCFFTVCISGFYRRLCNTQWRFEILNFQSMSWYALGVIIGTLCCLNWWSALSLSLPPINAWMYRCGWYGFGRIYCKEEKKNYINEKFARALNITAHETQKRMNQLIKTFSVFHVFFLYLYTFSTMFHSSFLGHLAANVRKAAHAENQNRWITIHLIFDTSSRSW